MRKTHTIYTRSTNGYSLRKSKVLSLGGSHLKWSNYIERDSRKANEVSIFTELSLACLAVSTTESGVNCLFFFLFVQEATLTAAEFSKKESEKHSGQSTTRITSRNHLTRKLDELFSLLGLLACSHKASTSIVLVYLLAVF